MADDWITITGFGSGRKYRFAKHIVIGIGEPLSVAEIRKGSVPTDEIHAGATIVYVNGHGRFQVSEKPETILKNLRQS